VGGALQSPPRLFRVNWFRTGADGQYLWPGFGENLRVLKWVLDRCDGRAPAKDTAIGLIPTPDAIDRTGLSLSDETMRDLLRVDPAEWADAVAGQHEFLGSFGDRTPAPLWEEYRTLARRIDAEMTPADLRDRERFEE
jgi:phosphoenolpyruvate carboxykinase (GTP)